MQRASPTPKPKPMGALDRWQPLAGGTAVWIFMTVEVVTFGMFLLGHAWRWQTSPDAMAAAQAQLHLESGVLSTQLLLAGSGCAYLGVLAWRSTRSTLSAAMLWTAGTLGAAFAVHKVMEWIPLLQAGHGLSSGPFWFTYLFLTQLHFLHVLPGVLALWWIAAAVWRPTGRTGLTETVDTVAAYWHLVDVIWLLLFTIVYVMHP